MNVSRETAPEAIAGRFDVSRETLDRLTIYAALLLRWNRMINLVGRADEAALWTRHIADSLQLVALMPKGVGRAIDLGSGGGLPGLILAIATGTHFHLVESDVRKAAFLREAARETNAPVTVHPCRSENATIAPAGLVTARALAPLLALLDLAAPFLASGGICLFPKGRDAEHELTEARRRWNMRLDQIPSAVDAGGSILRISEVARV